MTQFQHTLKALLEGRKTETSRIVKVNQLWYPNLGVIADSDDHGWNNRTVWAIGKDYAIEPHRGVRSVGRYRVEAIWRQDVRTLTLGQVDAEGFGAPLWIGFWEVWCKMHDPQAVADMQHIRALTGSQLDAKKILAERPAERYQAWRMTIRVLWEAVDWDAPAVRALHIDQNGL